MEQKEKLVARAAAEHWVSFFEHDPETAAATIEADNDSFTVRPVAPSGGKLPCHKSNGSPDTATS